MADTELLDYVREHLRRGRSEAQIREVLEDQGHSADSVDEAFSCVRAARRRRQGGFLLAALLLAGAALVVWDVLDAPAASVPPADNVSTMQEQAPDMQVFRDAVDARCAGLDAEAACRHTFVSECGPLPADVQPECFADLNETYKNAWVGE